MKNNGDNGGSIELETKAILNTFQYKQLMDKYRKVKVSKVVLCDDLYDFGNWALNRMGVTLRVRRTNGVNPVLEIKKDIKNQRGRLEIPHGPLSLKEELALRHRGEIPNGPVRKALNALGWETPLILNQGPCITSRFEFPHKGCLIALDHITYLLDKCEYRIECQQSDAKADDRLVLSEILKEQKITYIPAGSKRRKHFRILEEAIGIIY